MHFIYYLAKSKFLTLCHPASFSPTSPAVFPTSARGKSIHSSSCLGQRGVSPVSSTKKHPGSTLTLLITLLLQSGPWPEPLTFLIWSVARAPYWHSCFSPWTPTSFYSHRAGRGILLKHKSSYCHFSAKTTQWVATSPHWVKTKLLPMAVTRPYAFHLQWLIFDPFLLSPSSHVHLALATLVLLEFLYYVLHVPVSWPLKSLFFYLDWSFSRNPHDLLPYFLLVFSYYPIPPFSGCFL